MEDRRLVNMIADLLTQKGLSMATAESCTGGLLAHTLTNVSGSSAWFVGGVVVYANILKEQWLGVRHEILWEHGAVSSACAVSMALGVCRMAGVRIGVSLTGIAGPTGGSLAKPVGTVHIAWCMEGQVTCTHHLFSGDREMVKRQSVSEALRGLHDRLQTLKGGKP